MKSLPKTNFQQSNQLVKVNLNALTLIVTLLIVQSFALSFATVIIYRLCLYPLGGLN